MNLIDYILNLFRSPNPDVARAFVQNPVQAASTATGQAVTAAQLQTAYTAVAPVSAAYGGGDPIVGMQRAVANHNNLEFEPARVLSPDTEFASRNNTNAEFLSNNDPQVLSPHAGESVQQGGVNLDFSDMTFGDRNEASEGSVINTGTAGDIDATNVKGDGNVVGDDNENVNTGDIEDSNVNIGEDNEIDDSGDQTAGGDIISGNDGPVINDVDMSGGNGGGASGGSGGGGLIGVGNDGGNATGGAGGAGGGIVINDNDTTTNNVDGNQTTVGDIGGDVSGGISGGTSTEDNSVDNSVDNSGQDNSVDNSTDNSGQVNTDVDVSTNVDAGLF
jgi:hypothetical protein